MAILSTAIYGAVRIFTEKRRNLFMCHFTPRVKIQLPIPKLFAPLFAITYAYFSPPKRR